jgi:hypothetical protein
MKHPETSNIKRHLGGHHHIDVDKALIRKRSSDDINSVSPSINSPVIRGLTSFVNVDNFRNCLTQWVIECHVPFTVVETDSFQALLNSINPSISDYFIRTGNSVRN